MVYSDHIRLLNPALPERQPLYRFGYAIDPDPVMSCPRLKPAARLVYRAILRLCGRGTVCRASVDQIAAQAGVSIRSVQRHVSILTDRDLIETEEEPGSLTIFRLLPLPAWITEGRRPVLAEEPGPGTPDRRPETGDRGPETEGSGSNRVFPSSVSTQPNAPGRRVPPPCLPSAPEGRQPDGGGVTVCQGRGDKLSPPMDRIKHELENPISLSGLGSDSGIRWTDQPPAPEREEVGEGRDHETIDHKTTRPQVSGPVVPAPPTPRQIVQATCQVLGFRPTEAQVSFGVREVATLHAGGFSLTEIGEGARYAAGQGWVRSFAGVKFYLPQALNKLSLKAAQERETATPGLETEDRGPGTGGPVSGLPSPVSRRKASEESPYRDLWDQVREKIATRIQRQSYRTWFEPACIADFDGQGVVLEVSSHFFSEWLEEHYLDLIEATFEEVLGRRVEVTIETPEGGG